MLCDKQSPVTAAHQMTWFAELMYITVEWSACIIQTASTRHWPHSNDKSRHLSSDQPLH